MGAGHDHSHNVPTEMQVGDQTGGGQITVDFDAVNDYYSNQLAQMHQQSAMLAGRLSAALKDNQSMAQELIRVNNELHDLKDQKAPKAKPIRDNPQA